jgi:hypothetical protein
VRRIHKLQLLSLLGVAVAALFVVPWLMYPSDRTPEGAYLRVMSAVNRAQPEDFFAYLETPAQHASFTLHDYAKKSYELVAADYPEPERSRTLERLGELAKADAGPSVFAIYARRYGWLERLRRDLSGVESVEIHGERASVETVRGTRYPFRRRDNGIWGLTLFTARLVSDAEKAARDHAMIQAAAQDFRAGRTARALPSAAGAGAVGEASAEQ